MKIVNVDKPAAIPPVTVNTQKAAEARAKAIAAFASPSAAQAAPPVPQNQNAVAPEETVHVPKVATPTSTPTEPTIASPEANQSVKTPSQEPTSEPDESVSRQFAQLARQERALRQRAQAQQQAIREQEQAIQAKERELAAKEQEYRSGYISKDRIRQDALQVLAEANVSYDDLTQQILNQGKTDPRTTVMLNQLQDKIKTLEQQIETTNKTYENNQTEARQSAVRQISRDVKVLVDQDPAFETIRAQGAHRAVVKLITDTYDKDGVLLSNDEAAQLVEEELVNRALKLMNINKIKSKLSAGATASQAAEKTTQSSKTDGADTPPTMKTLTNAAASPRKLSARERAILAFSNQLK